MELWLFLVRDLATPVMLAAGFGFTYWQMSVAVAGLERKLRDLEDNHAGCEHRLEQVAGEAARHQTARQAAEQKLADEQREHQAARAAWKQAEEQLGRVRENYHRFRNDVNDLLLKHPSS